MKSNSGNRNLDIAAFAMRCVNNVANNEDRKAEFKDEYKTLVKRMPTLIQKNGYISTLAFCYSKGRKEHAEVLENIIDWNYENDKIKNLVFGTNNKKLKYSYDKYIEKIVALDQKSYRIISREMMILFGWIKRFADGMIEDEW